MRSLKGPSPHLFFAGAALFYLALSGITASAATTSKYAGSYDSEPIATPVSLPTGTTAQTAPSSPSFSVSLGADGSATTTEDSGKGAVTSFGHWSDTGGQITVVFLSSANQAAEPPLILQPRHDGLQAVSWNHAFWGKLTPPLLKKGAANWHSRGHHGFL